MAKPITHVSILWSDPLSGSYNLDDILSADFGDGDSAENLFSIGQEPIGVRTARGASTISLSQLATVENANLPPWEQLKLTGALCLATREDRAADGTAGARVQFEVQVATVAMSVSGEGNVTREVTLAVKRSDPQ